MASGPWACCQGSGRLRQAQAGSGRLWKAPKGSRQLEISFRPPARLGSPTAECGGAELGRLRRVLQFRTCVTRNCLGGPAEQKALGRHVTLTVPPDLTETDTNHTGAQSSPLLQIALSSRAPKLSSQTRWVTSPGLPPRVESFTALRSSSALGAERDFDRQEGRASPERGSVLQVPELRAAPRTLSGAQQQPGQCRGATARLPSFPDMAAGGRWNHESTTGNVQP